MLGGDWVSLTLLLNFTRNARVSVSGQLTGYPQNDAFIFYSGFTEEHLIPGHNLLVEKLTEEGFHKQYVCKKYANKKFLKASVFAIEWARSQLGADDTPESMVTTD